MTRQSPPGGTPNRPPKAPARLVKDAALLDKLTRPADPEPPGSQDPDYDGGAASRSEQSACIEAVACAEGFHDVHCPRSGAYGRMMSEHIAAAEAAQSTQEGAAHETLEQWAQNIANVTGIALEAREPVRLLALQLLYSAVKRESPGPLAALQEHRTILLDAVQSHDCAGRGECWCDDAWRVLGIPWGRVDLARAALREYTSDRPPNPAEPEGKPGQ